MIAPLTKIISPEGCGLKIYDWTCLLPNFFFFLKNAIVTTIVKVYLLTFLNN